MKRLFALSGNRCAYHDEEEACQAPLVRGQSILGEICHINAAHPKGPRYDPAQSDAERHGFSNLVLMCGTHHKIIDDDVGTFTVARLRSMKSEHEASASERYAASQTIVGKSIAAYKAQGKVGISATSVGQRGGLTVGKIAVHVHPSGRTLSPELSGSAGKRSSVADAFYSTTGKEWATRADIAHWDAWTSWMFSAGPPSLDPDQDVSLGNLRRWLLARPWPGRRKRLEAAFHNFCRVLCDFLRIFHEHAEVRGKRLMTESFYRIPEWNPDRYNRLLQEFREHVNLVRDLALELTRAANYVCECMRSSVDSCFALDEGVLTITMSDSLSIATHRIEYRLSEKKIAPPYPGIAAFLALRGSRDWSFENERED